MLLFYLEFIVLRFMLRMSLTLLLGVGAFGSSFFLVCSMFYSIYSYRFSCDIRTLSFSSSFRWLADYFFL